MDNYPVTTANNGEELRGVGERWGHYWGDCENRETRIFINVHGDRMEHTLIREVSVAVATYARSYRKPVAVNVPGWGEILVEPGSEEADVLMKMMARMAKSYATALDEAVTPTSQSATSVYEVCARLADDMGQPAVAVAIRAVAKAAQKK